MTIRQTTWMYSERNTEHKLDGTGVSVKASLASDGWSVYHNGRKILGCKERDDLADAKIEAEKFAGKIGELHD